jgi:hypothetical protein
VLLNIDSVVFFKYKKKTYLIIKKDDPVKTTLIFSFYNQPPADRE